MSGGSRPKKYANGFKHSAVVREPLLSFSERLQEIRTGFERPFWVANISEIFERLSYYGAFASLALYLQERLNFSAEQTGTLTGIFGGMVWFLAIFGGAAADRLGFRRALSIAYLILAAAYFLIGSIGAAWLAPVRNAVPLSLFVGFILILPALGVSLVKPCVVGTTARASKPNVRSIGYSIYYTMVNIGGAAGPLFASWAHRHLGVESVYRVSALFVFAMFFVVLSFSANRASPETRLRLLSRPSREISASSSATTGLSCLCSGSPCCFASAYRSIPSSPCLGGSGLDSSHSSSPASAASCGSSFSSPDTGSSSGSSTSVCPATFTATSIHMPMSRSSSSPTG